MVSYHDSALQGDQYTAEGEDNDEDGLAPFIISLNFFVLLFHRLGCTILTGWVCSGHPSSGNERSQSSKSLEES